MNLSTKQRISMAAAYKGLNLSEIARAIGMTPSALHSRLKRNALSTDAIRKIASALGAEYTDVFEFPDGTKI